VGDLRGAVYDARGVDVPAFASSLTAADPIAELGFGEAVTASDLLSLECDILIPAATGEVIDASNAGDVRAHTIIEAANHPVTADAEPLLSANGITVVPDILANAGGVIVSYFEWTQNIQQFRWPEDRVNDELRERMVAAYRAVRGRTTGSTTMREAAFEIAVDRVAQAIRLRGFV
jgi:glutamate dehydrogenase (NAD(P)+)